MDRRSKLIKRGIKGVVSLLVTTMLITVFAPKQNVHAAEKAYLDTDSSYVMDNLGQSLESTENTGMVWTDKSVAENGTTTFSIGANAQKVIGKTSEPTDTVIILDVSQGMLSTEKDKETNQVVYKIQSALEAANDTIDILMSANEKNRVSVVAYSGKRLYTDNEVYDPNDNQVVELLPLAHYMNKKPIDKEYLTLEFLNVKENGVSFDPVKQPEGIVESHAWKQGDKEKTSSKAYLGGMSNLQYGLSIGMDVLASATNIEVDGSPRQPNVLLFMGSLPQESCADPQWWNPTLTENSNIQYCNRETNDAAHTVKAIMVGAYKKKQIEKHYGVKANLFVSQIHITTNERKAFTKEEWQTVSMSGTQLQEIVNAYVKKQSCEIPAGLQNNKQGAVYTLNQHPDVADDITADEIFNYIDASFAFDTQEFEQAKILEGTSNVIKDTITDVEVPLEKDSYVTYTDPIGKYMQITPYDPNNEGTGINFKLATNDGTDVEIVFKKETVLEGGTIEYTEPEVTPNIDDFDHTVYGTKYAEELQKVNIRLENNNGKKTLVAKIPATLIPMGISTVRYDKSGKLESMKRTKDESAKPFKLVYEVKVDKKICQNKNSDKLRDEKVDSDYLRQNTSADGSKVYFYSTYKGENTQVTFTPSSTNQYYYFTEDTPVYKDKGCTTLAGVINQETTYYYKEEYFNGAKAYTKVKTVKGSDVNQDKGHIAKGTFKHLNINAQTIKKNNTLPGDLVVNDYVSQLNADGKTIKNTFGNIAVYELAKPDKYPKEFVLTYDDLKEDKDLFTCVQADTKTSFNIWVDSTTEGPILGKIADDKNETVLDNLSIKDHYIKDVNDKPISLSLGDKLYLYGENFDPNTKVKVSVAETSPAFSDKESMTKEANLVTGINEMVVCPKLLAEKNLPETEISFNVGLTGEGKENIPFNFTWSGEKNATVVGTIDPVTISSSAKGTTGTAKAKVTAPLGTSSIYIRQSNFQPGIIYDEGILKVNLKTVINAEGKYVTSVTGYEKSSYVDGKLQYTSIADINETPAFTNKVATEVTGTQVMVSGKLSLKKASTKVSGTDKNITGNNPNGVVYDQVMETGEYNNPIKFKIELKNAEVPFAIVTVDGSGMFSMVSPVLEKGTYQYDITPVAAKGIEYDAASNTKTIAITVDDSGNGTWMVVGDSSLEFNGTYKPTGTITLNYVNNLTGRKFFGKEKVNVGETTLEYNGTKVSDTINEFSLSSTAGASSVSQSRNMSVYLPGEYVFSTTMKEGEKGKGYNDTMLSNVTCYDLGDKKLTVQVVDKMDGTLLVPKDNNFELNWEYRPAQQMVETEGILINADGFHLKAGEFQYQITPLNGAPIGIYSSPISNPEMELETKQATINKLKFQFTGKEIADQFDKQDITGYQDHKATFSYLVKEFNQGSTYGHDQSEYKIDITFSVNERAQIIHAEGSQDGTIKTIITKIKDSNGKEVNESVTGAMVFNHVVQDAPVKVDLAPKDTILEASLSGRSSKPLEEKEITLKAVAVKSTDNASIDITKANENVQIYKMEKKITVDEFVKNFSVQNDGSGKFVITDYKIEFKKPGIYKLNLEPTNLAEGWNYIGTKSAIKYVVTEENGELKVHVSNEFGMNTLRYYFEYHPQEKIDIYVQEELTGRDWIIEDEITSTVEGSAQSISIKQDTPDHTVKVATVTLGESSSFRCTIKNEIKSDTGLVKTPEDGKVESKVLKITASDVNDDGTLEIKATLDDIEIKLLSGNETLNKNKKIKIGFKTQYKILNKEQKNLITVNENFKGRENDAWLDTDQFTFTLRPNDEKTKLAVENKEITVSNNTVTMTKNDKDYTAQLGDFTYTKSGKYKFELVQETPSMPAVSAAETSSFVFELNVEDDKKGSLSGTIQNSDTYVFNNTYTVESISKDITLPQGSVEVRSGDGKVDNVPYKKFEFQLKDVKDKISTSYNDENGSVLFGNFSYDKAGIYQYTVVTPVIKEPESKYWKLANKTETTVKVNVKDDNKGHLVVESLNINNPKFVFEYYVEDARVKTSVSMALTGREWKTDDVFEFKIAPKEDYGNNRVKMPENPIAFITNKNQAKGVSFDDIIFSHVGIYTFNISEVDKDAKGITYDKSIKEIRISVTDSGTGSLIAKVICGSLENTFTNTYAAVLTKVSKIEVAIYLTGRNKNTWLDTDKFTFTLAAADDVTKNAVNRKEIILNNSQITITNEKLDHKASFGDITFNKAGNYKFYVKETKGNIPGVVYDESVKTISVQVTDDTLGHLIAKVIEDDHLVFKNIYNLTEASSQIKFASNSVVVKGEKGVNPELKDGEFTFEMEPSQNYAADVLELPKNKKARNAADGSIVFDSITFKKPGTYVFEVDQDTSNKKTYWDLDSSKKTVTFEVTDDYQGRLNVKVENEKDLKFMNTYTPSDVVLAPTVRKDLTGRIWKADDEFKFTLAPKEDYGENVKLPAETTVSITGNDKDKNVPFDNITFSHTGKYIFNISEIDTEIKGIQYDSAKEFTVEVTDDVRGSLKAEVVGGSLNNTFTNTYSVADGIGKVTVTKNLIGRPWIKGKDEYVFTMNIDIKHEATRSAYINKDIVFNKREIVIDTDSQNHQATFEDILFKKPGTYRFLVNEITRESIPGIVYDESVKVITFEVNDQELNGKYEVKMTPDSCLEFNNTYSPKPATYDVTGLVGINAEKGTNPQLENGEFTFKMKPYKDYPADALELPNNMTAQNAEDGSIVFDSITFKKPGTYVFEVDQDTSKTYWDLDSSKKTVTFEVTDDYQGRLNIKVENEKDLKFMNTYTPSDVVLAPTVRKDLTGRIWKADDEFKFTLAPKENYGENVKLPAETTVSITGTNELKEVSFEGITFSHTGTYGFEIREVKPENAIPKITYDNSVKEITVEITDEGKGCLIANVISGSKNNEFTNEYAADPVTISGNEYLTVTKGFTGRLGDEWLDTDEFTFTLSAADDVTKTAVNNEEITFANDEIQITKMTENHKASFGDITFKKAGTYQFNVNETKGNIPGIAYDTATKTVKVEVTDDLVGNLTANVVQKDPLEFNNTYHCSETKLEFQFEKGTLLAQGSKGVEPKLQKDQFTFKLKAKGDYSNDDLELPNMTASSAEDGSISFGQMTFKKSGEYQFEVQQDVSNKKEGWTYDTAVKIVTFVVTDENQGNFVVKAEGLENQNFTNQYNPKDATLKGPVVAKILKGRNWRESDKFEFTLTAEKDYGSSVKLPEELVVSIGDKGRTKEAAFGDIIFCEAGRYHFMISEKNTDVLGIIYDQTVRNFVVEVSDDGNGSLVATEQGEEKSPYIFTNIYSSQEVVLNGSTNLAFKSTVKGRQWKAGEIFTYKLTPQTKNAPMPEEAEVSVSKPAEGDSAEFYFENIVYKNVNMEGADYTEEGVKFKTFDYLLELKQPINNPESGMKYDTRPRKIAITVFDKGEGNFTATSKITGNKEFVNVYSQTLVYNDLRIENAMVGKEEFKFSVQALDEQSKEKIGSDTINVSSPSANNGEPVTIFPFNGIQFTQDDIGKTFSYEIKENEGSDKPYTVEITVTETPTFTAETKISKDGQEISNTIGVPAVVSFKHDWSCNVSIQATLPEGTPEGEYGFVIKNSKGETVVETNKSTSAPFTFPAITYDSMKLEEDVNNGIAQKDTDGSYLYPYSVAVIRMPEGVTPIRGEYQIAVKVKAGEEPSVTYPENRNFTFEKTSQDTRSYHVNGRLKLDQNGGRVTLADFAGKYSYIIEGEDGAPIPTNSEDLTVNNDEAGNIDFGEIVFNKDLLEKETPDDTGVKSITYRYTIQRKDDAENVEEQTFDIILKEENGILTASLVGADTNTNNEFEFKKEYEIAPKDVPIGTFKVSLPERPLKDQEFQFELKDKDHNQVATGKNAVGGTVSMEPAITINKPGTYVYTLNQVNGGKSGITYDATIYNVIVVAKDNKDGSMDVTCDTSGITFQNSYTVEPTSVWLSANTHLKGRKIKAEEFRFVLKDEEGKVLQTKTNDIGGAVLFDEISYKEVGRHIYTIEQIKGTDSNMIYDDKVYQLNVEVKENQGYLEPEITESSIIFFNEYKAEEPNNQNENPGQGDASEDSGSQNTVVKEKDAKAKESNDKLPMEKESKDKLSKEEESKEGLSTDILLKEKESEDTVSGNQPSKEIISPDEISPDESTVNKPSKEDTAVKEKENKNCLICWIIIVIALILAVEIYKKVKNKKNRKN